MIVLPSLLVVHVWPNERGAAYNRGLIMINICHQFTLSPPTADMYVAELIEQAALNLAQLLWKGAHWQICLPINSQLLCPWKWMVLIILKMKTDCELEIK